MTVLMKIMKTEMITQLKNRSLRVDSIYNGTCIYRLDNTDNKFERNIVLGQRVHWLNIDPSVIFVMVRVSHL